MPFAPMGLRVACGVTLTNLSGIAWRNPVFIESAITSVVTPDAPPTTASSVTIRSTAGRFGERRYRNATSHSNVILFHRSFQPAARQARRLRCVAAEKGLLHGSRGNRLATLPGGRCRRLRRRWAATHAKAREYNRCPLPWVIPGRLFQLVRESAPLDRKDHSAPKSRSQVPSPR